MGKTSFRVASPSSYCTDSFLALGSTRGRSVDSLTYQLMSLLLYSGRSITSRSLQVECIQPSLAVLGELYVSSSSIKFAGSVQVSSRTCHKLIQTSQSSGSLLDGGSLASHSSQHVGRCSSSVSHHKGSCCGCFGRPGTQESTMPAFNPLAAQRCVLYRQGSLLGLSGGGWGDSSIYNTGLPAVLERMDRLVCLKGCTKQCYICP